MNQATSLSLNGKGFRGWCVCGLTLWSFCLGGCGASAPDATDVESATTLMESTLAAWQSGATVAELRERSPAVYVSDESWLQGFQLDEYKIEGAGEPLGTNVRFQVTLKGSNAGGRKVERKVKYLVATTPAQSVARDDR